jgi:hypothetical protein
MLIMCEKHFMPSSNPHPAGLASLHKDGGGALVAEIHLKNDVWKE